MAKFTRGAPVPESCAPSRLHVVPVRSNFDVREEEPPVRPNRFRRGDRLPPPLPSGLVNAADIREPLIPPVKYPRFV